MIAVTTLYSALEALFIVCGIALIGGVIGVSVYAVTALDKDRSVLPWGTHKRVASARARTQVADEELKQEKLEIERMALQPVRQRVLKAIEDGEPVTKELLSGDGKGEDPVAKAMREKHFGQDHLPMIPVNPFREKYR